MAGQEASNAGQVILFQFVNCIPYHALKNKDRTYGINSIMLSPTGGT